MQSLLLKSMTSLLMTAMIVLATAVANAAPPSSINYQGYLTSQTGTPVNGTIKGQLRIDF
ncbi:MAG: hypothetical protein LH481_14970 [Burkholderiales bacterium]|nr:hypothetical protein [Burkholderiales bacterium]